MWESMGERDRKVLDDADSAYRRWARQRLRTDRLVALVVETSEGRIVASGCIWLQPVQPRPGYGRLEDPYLLSMYTEPAHRGRGLAKRIVREAIRWCKDQGYPRLALHASLEGRGLYRGLGFERTWEMRIRLRSRGA